MWQERHQNINVKKHCCIHVTTCYSIICMKAPAKKIKDFAKSASSEAQKTPRCIYNYKEKARNSERIYPKHKSNKERRSTAIEKPFSFFPPFIFLFEDLCGWSCSSEEILFSFFLLLGPELFCVRLFCTAVAFTKELYLERGVETKRIKWSLFCLMKHWKNKAIFFSWREATVSKWRSSLSPLFE